MFELSVKGDIASGHFLRGYEGKCKDPHGHTWKVQVTIGREKLDHIGMVTDFIDLKRKLKDFLSQIDHINLNEHQYFKDVNPTTENIAKYIFQNFIKHIEPLEVKKVQVWESDNSSITYYQ